MPQRQSVLDSGRRSATASTTADDLAGVEARLDRLPVSRFSYILLLLLMPAWMVESYDIGIIGATIGVIRPLWQPTAGELGLLGVASTVAIALGLIPSGMLVDAWGRRKVLICGVIWFSIFTALAATSSNIMWLAGYRFVAGLGLGAVFPLPYVILAEFLAPSFRAKFVGYLNGLLTAAYVVPPLVAVYFIGTFPPDTAWRLLHGVAIVQLAYAVVLYVWLPESPRWLASKGKVAEALAIINRLEAQAKPGAITEAPTSYPPLPSGPRPLAGTWRDILKPPLLSTTITVCLAFFGTLPAFYVLLTFAPALMASQGFELAKSLQFVALLQLAGGLGGVLQGFLADKWGRRPLIVAYGLLAVVGLAGLALAQTKELLLAASVAVGFFGLGIFPVTKLFVAEQFPTAIRGWGTSTAEAFGRFFGGVVFVYSVPFIVAASGTKTVVAIVAAFLLFATVLPVSLFGAKTK